MGDSMLIVLQLSEYCAPKNDKLLRAYREACSLAGLLGVARRYHHLRAYIKVVDTSANVAMDGLHSIQSYHPTDRPEWAGLAHLLDRDYSHCHSAASADR